MMRSVLCSVLWLRYLVTIAFAFQATAVPRWGTFRPQSLIAARAPVPHSPYFGFAYHPANSLDIRHVAADHVNKIHSFSWSRHDGSNFGDQQIRDRDSNLLISTSFVAHPSESACVLRISAVPLDPDLPVSITSVVLFAVSAPEEMLSEADRLSTRAFLQFPESAPSSSLDSVRINGSSGDIGGDYTIRIQPPLYGSITADSFEQAAGANASEFHGTGSRSRLRLRSERHNAIPDEVGFFQLGADTTDYQQSWHTEKLIERKLTRSFNLPGRSSSIRVLDPGTANEASALFVQRLVRAPFQLEATLVVTDGMTSKNVGRLEHDLSGERLDRRLTDLRQAFDKKFDSLFLLGEKGFSDQVIAVGREALSNILGGVGFFYGSSVVQGKGSDLDNAGLLRPIGLLTATPSRVVFPRGFLWDEGFHQEIIRHWDANLSLGCLQSWLAAAQTNGWIPREQILGLEARNRFPAHVRHLMIQNPTVANPPTILMSLPSLWTVMSGKSLSKAERAEWQRTSSELMSKVVRYYKWMRGSQSGALDNSFRWRGRSLNSKAPDGYPLTLSSGLDDYPRGFSVSDRERHVDLHSWMTWTARLIARMKEASGEDGAEFWSEYKVLKASLIEHHTVPSPRKGNREDLLFCDYDGQDRICHEGYVTILPLLLGLLDVNDIRVGVILDALEDPDRLRARAGVRSLSQKDRWHRRGDDYWTGSVWMPFNYLTLAALKTKYAAESGPYKKRALDLYKSLRESIIENTVSVYLETGQLWENYSPGNDGAGKSGRQFTGWTSLILLIIAEMYDNFA